MKKNQVAALIYILLGLFLAISPQKLFPVCEKMEKVMKCHWSAQAEIGIGLIIVALGILLIVFKTKETQIALSLAGFVSGITAILIPTILIGGCKKPEMLCRTHAFPAIYLASAILIIFSLGYALYQKNSKEI